MFGEREKQKSRELIAKNIWITKVKSVRNNIKNPDIRNLWNAKVAEKLWIASESKCAITGNVMEPFEAAFVMYNLNLDFEPSNAVIVRKWISKTRNSNTFDWNAEQRDRIKKCRDRFRNL
jgi:hypothetical protein